MKFLIIALVALFAGASTVHADFVGAFLPNTPAGYQLASFQDIVSAEFVNQYNTVGISFVAAYGGPVCCAVSVQEGFLTFAGGVGGYLENFANGTDCCTSGTSPANTTLGVPPFANSPYEGTWLKQLDPKALSLLGVNSTIPALSFASCSSGTTKSAYFKKIGPSPPPPTTPAPTAPQLPYMISPYGAHYTAPVGYRAMALSDVLSSSFVSYYNSNGIRLIGNYTNNYCCMLQLQDNGWLTYGAEGNFSPFSLFQNGYWSCGSAAMGGLVTLGTSFGGPYNLLFPTLNATTLQLVGEFYNNTARDFDGCDSLDDSLTMWTLQ